MRARLGEGDGDGDGDIHHGRSAVGVMVLGKEGLYIIFFY